MTDVLARLDQVVRDFERAAVATLDDTGHQVLDKSNEHAPRDDGTLIASGKVRVDAGKLEVTIGYSAPYAVEQHEDLNDEHDPGRGPKFLENAGNDKRAILDEQARGLKKRVGL